MCPNLFAHLVGYHGCDAMYNVLPSVVQRYKRDYWLLPGVEQIGVDGPAALTAVPELDDSEIPLNAEHGSPWLRRLQNGRERNTTVQDNRANAHLEHCNAHAFAFGRPGRGHRQLHNR